MDEFTKEQQEELYKAARSAARRVALSWPETVEAEDLAQDILVHLMGRPGALSRTLEEDYRTRQSFLIKLGHQLASQQQSDYDFFSGNYLYDVETVRDFLNRGLLTDNVEHFKSEKEDLLQGVDMLRDNQSPYYAEIINRYLYDIRPGSTDSAGKMRLSRAVEAVTGNMNRIGRDKANAHQGPGSRTVFMRTMPMGDDDV